MWMLRSGLYGIRPGEKLYEEVLVEGENIMPTYHKKIRIFAGARKSGRPWRIG